MLKKTDYEISVKHWIKEQENLIELIEHNIQYLEKEVELKIKSLEISRDSLIHEKQSLKNCLNADK
jgi:hypothetical protein